MIENWMVYDVTMSSRYPKKGYGYMAQWPGNVMYDATVHKWMATSSEKMIQFSKVDQAPPEEKKHDEEEEPQI